MTYYNFHRKKNPSDKGGDPRTPAPPKDRIYGSRRNAPGSASEANAEIDFGPRMNAMVEEWVEEQNSKAPKTKLKYKVTEGQLKSVCRRAMGAYSKSHRPGVTREGWCRGRMRAFIHLLETGKPKNPRYVQDNDLLPDGHPAVRKKNPSKRASKPREIVFVAAGMLQPFFASKSGKNKAVSFLKNLHKKYEPYLISSMPYEEVDEFWREEKLYRYFRDFYTSDTQTQYGWLKGRDWTFLADSPRKSKFVTEWMNRLNKSSKGTFKNISNLKWEGAAKREKNPSIARDVLHEMLYEVSPDYSRELFAEYYEVSAEDPEKLLLQYPEPPSKYYYGRNFVWIGDPGRMLKLYAEDVVPMDGNIFYPEKLTAVASVSQWNDGDKIPLIPGYGIPVIMDEERIEEAFEYQEYDLYYRPDYDDDGEILVQVRDGNHRTFGALLSGEPYVYVKVDSNTYRDYKNWAKSGGRLDNVDADLMHYLNKNLE